MCQRDWFLVLIKCRRIFAIFARELCLFHVWVTLIILHEMIRYRVT